MSVDNPLHRPQLADFLQTRANESTKTLIFLIGGAYGVDETVVKEANAKWSLSKLVFPHQLVRLILGRTTIPSPALFFAMKSIIMLNDKPGKTGQVHMIFLKAQVSMVHLTGLLSLYNSSQ